MATLSDPSALRNVKRPLVNVVSSSGSAQCKSKSRIAPNLFRATTLAEIPETNAANKVRHATPGSNHPAPSVANGRSHLSDDSDPLEHPIAQSAPLRRRSRSVNCLEEFRVSVSECPICFNEFADDDASLVPRNLTCGHTYCAGCLQNLVLRIKLPSMEISCPHCKMPTMVKDGNVQNLPRNFALLEVIRSSQSPRSSPVMGQAYSETRRNSQGLEERHHEDGQSKAKQQYCQKHGDHLSSYCTYDGQLICSTCLYYGSAHKNHRTLLVKDAAKESRQNLRKFNPEVIQQKKRMEFALSEVNTTLEDVKTAGARLCDEVDGQFDSLVQLIDERRRRVKLEIMERTQLRAYALLQQSKELGDSVQQASVVQHHSERLLESDDYSLLSETLVTTEQIEGVFINPPSTHQRANADLMCEFSSGVSGELDTLLEGFANIRSSVGTIKQLTLEAYHDGIRISWTGHNYVDNHGISYHLQMATNQPGSVFTNIHRGGDTKFTLKYPDLEDNVTYRFRVQVRTTEGVGNWSDVQEVCRAPPAFRWHSTWRSVKISLSPDKLQAMWCGGGTHKYWATFAGDCFFKSPGHYYMEIEIVSLGKHKGAKKLAIGVVDCSSKCKAGELPWVDGKFSIGQWKDVKSWSFHPISGVINSSSLPIEGKPYASSNNLQEGDRIGMLVDMDAGKVSYFCNGQDLGVAFESEEVGVESLLPAVSIRDKICVRLRFPPPPYSNRTVRLVQLRTYSSGSMIF